MKIKVNTLNFSSMYSLQTLIKEMLKQGYLFIK